MREICITTWVFNEDIWIQRQDITNLHPTFRSLKLRGDVGLHSWMPLEILRKMTSWDEVHKNYATFKLTKYFISPGLLFWSLLATSLSRAYLSAAWSKTKLSTSVVAAHPTYRDKLSMLAVWKRDTHGLIQAIHLNILIMLTIAVILCDTSYAPPLPSVVGAKQWV